MAVAAIVDIPQHEELTSRRGGCDRSPALLVFLLTMVTRVLNSNTILSGRLSSTKYFPKTLLSSVGIGNVNLPVLEESRAEKTMAHPCANEPKALEVYRPHLSPTKLPGGCS